MNFIELFLNGAYKIDLEKNEDDRGFFSRVWCKNEFEEHGLDTSIVQINNSLRRKKCTLIGLHFQRPPKTEAKIVRCLRGAIWDVIVDLRKDSPTFGQWYGTELNDTNRTMIFVPQGFAHGYLTLSPDAEILYLVSEFHSPENEDGLRWNDPQLAIEWPDIPQVISDKDVQAPLLADLSPMDIQ